MSERMTGFNPEGVGVGNDELWPEQVESRVFSGQELLQDEVDERVRKYYGDFDGEEAMAALEARPSLRYMAPSEETAIKGAPPVLIAPGWTETQQIFEEEAFDLLMEGYGVLTSDHARRGKAHEAPEELGLEEKGLKLTKSGFERALGLLNGVERSDFEGVSVVAHSEGCVDALVAALMVPDKFKGGIVLVNPPMLEKDNVVALAGRFTPQLLKNSLAQNMAGNREIAKNPARAISEVLSIAGSDLLQLAGEVRELGVPVTLILGERDTVYPPEKVFPRLEKIQHVDDEKEEDFSPLPFDLVSTMEGHHNTMHEPDSGVTELLDQHLRFMRNQGRELM